MAGQGRGAFASLGCGTTLGRPGRRGASRRKARSGSGTGRLTQPGEYRACGCPRRHPSQSFRSSTAMNKTFGRRSAARPGVRVTDENAKVIEIIKSRCITSIPRLISVAARRWNDRGPTQLDWLRSGWSGNITSLRVATMERHTTFKQTRADSRTILCVVVPRRESQTRLVFTSDARPVRVSIPRPVVS
jgi:hypothetical protein